MDQEVAIPLAFSTDSSLECTSGSSGSCDMKSIESNIGNSISLHLKLQNKTELKENMSAFRKKEMLVSLGKIQRSITLILHMKSTKKSNVCDQTGQLQRTTSL